MADKKRDSASSEPVYAPDSISVKHIPAQKKARCYHVAHGSELCGTLRGKVRSGCEVHARDFVGGAGHLDELVKSGAVVVTEK